MRRRRRGTDTLFTNPTLVGAMILAVGLIGVVLSYNANKGLPFVPTYEISADVPDAAELIEGGSEVRIGGGRVGIVKEVRALPPAGRRRAVARLVLALNADVAELPADTTVQVRPRSVLGAKYLDVVPGRSRRTVPAGGVIPATQAKPIVELDEAFNTFDSETTRGIRSAVNVLGDAFAGRGSAINDAVAAFGHASLPLQRTIRTIVDDETNLPGFVRGIVATSTALEPVAPVLRSLIDNTATTLAAVDAAGNALGDSIAELPPTEIAGERALARLGPVLDDAAAISIEARRATPLLPTTSRRLARALAAGTPVLRRARELTRPLRTVLADLETLARDPAAPGSVRKLLATVTSTSNVLDVLAPAQLQCNYLGLYLRNVANLSGDGDLLGTWIPTLGIIEPDHSFQRATPAPNLHANPYPVETYSECEAGNQPFLPGQQIGNPPGVQSNRTEETRAPASARERARRAGLLTLPRGAR
jgi:virulence factor Mce-like protein